MGTSLRLSLLKDEFKSVVADASFERLQEIDRLLTVHNIDSQLMSMNRLSGTWISGREIAEVSAAALELGNKTEGAMDVTVLPAMRRFGFVPGSVTDSDRIDYSKLQVRGDKARVREEGVGADFGGIAKGYGVDEAVRILSENSMAAALIDAGGDLYALGRPEKDRLWKIGIRHPDRENDLVATLEIENEAVATSGTYLQKRKVGSKEVSHLMDPKTGMPVDHVLSSTIVTSSTMLADGLATATSVMKPTAAQHLIESTDGAEGFWIYSDGSHHITSGLCARLTLL